MVSSDYNEHMLELRANGLRSKGQSSRFLEDDCHNVVANMSLPQQLSSQTTMKNYHKLFTHALSNILIFLLWFCDYISSKFIWTLISSILNKFRNVLFFGHTMDVLPPFISVLCHSDWLFHRESCPRLDVVHPGCVWSSSPACTCPYIIFFSRQLVFLMVWPYYAIFLVLTMSSSSFFTPAL